MGKVNLDALIPREDFEVIEDSKTNLGTIINTIDANGLKKDGLFYNYLRKPDFQRETNEWEPKKVLGLIKSFINGDLIPSLILWHSSSGNYLFVIDGAHRLSALLSWINDDYGDGKISKEFFEHIPDEQIKIAQQTRKLVNEEIGPYSHYQLASTNPQDVKEDILKRAKSLVIRAFQLQWVNGDSEVAEQSFLTINQQATPINPTERKLIENRDRPNCISARAIRRSGTGHKYWGSFGEDIQKRIENLSKEINDLIFVPPYKKPIKSLDFPIAGNQNSGQSLSIILNFVNIVNGLNDKKQSELLKDDRGEETINYLTNCKKIAQRIRSTETSSLGLHPAVYLYSREGNYKPVSLYALLDLVLRFNEDKGLLNNFIKVREKFEEILLSYDYFIPQIVRKYRSGIKSYSHITDFYIKIIDRLSEGKTKEDTISEIIKDKEFNYLTTQKQELDEETSREFSLSAKSSVVLNEALDKALRCKICGGLIDSKCITIDHIQRKSEGGLGNTENGQIAHPYCNSTFKN